MITLIDSMILSTLLIAPIITVLYALMLTVADGILAAVKNWGGGKTDR